MTQYTYMESPVGRLLLEGDEEGLRRVAFAKDEGKAPQEINVPTPLQNAVNQLNKGRKQGVYVNLGGRP